MDVTYQKDVCFFVGGVGAKIGSSIAGGCTKAWLAAQGGDPSGLFGADGACVYSNASIQIGTNSRITGASGTFAGVEAGMVAYLDASDFDAGYYEVTDVGTNDEYVEFTGPHPTAAGRSAQGRREDRDPGWEPVGRAGSDAGDQDARWVAEDRIEDAGAVCAAGEGERIAIAHGQAELDRATQKPPDFQSRRVKA
jgi:hypothetical protein